MPVVLCEGVVTQPTDAALRQALGGGGTVTLAFSGKLVLDFPFIITNSTVIDGTGYQPTISGGGVWRVFEVLPGAQFTLKAVTIADGKAQGLPGEPAAVGALAQGQPGRGGGIFSDRADVVLINCVFTNNQTIGGVGGNGWSVPAPGGWGMGGAVCALGGTLRATSCRFEGNMARGGDGAQGGNGGSGSQGIGGAIYQSASRFELVSCVLVGNWAVGGQDWGGQGGLAVGNAYGGALYSDGTTNIVSGSRFQGNWTTAPRPGNLLLGGPGTTAGGAVFQANGHMETTESTFISNSVSRDFSRVGGGHALGGAICNLASLKLSRCELRDNAAIGGLCSQGRSGDAYGGGLFNAATAIVEDSVLRGNRATGGEGAWATGGPGQGFGGAVWNTNVLTVTGTTVSFNRATSLSSTAGSDNMSAQPGFGGGLGNMGSVAATNNTFAGNSAEGGPGSFSLPPDYQQGWGADAFGGAIYSRGGSVLLVHQTFSGNRATAGTGLTPGVPHGGAIFSTNGVVTLRGAILAESGAGMNIEGPIVDGGNNLSSDTTPAFTSASSRKNIDPMLGPLADNGGPTPTMALLEGSPAIDAIDVGSSYPTTDQRGQLRPSGAASDIGAFELDRSPAPLHLTISLPESDSILLHVEGIQSTRHILERSGNLTTWEPIWTNATLPFDFFQTLVGPPGAKWYRARAEP